MVFPDWLYYLFFEIGVSFVIAFFAVVVGCGNVGRACIAAGVLVGVRAFAVFFVLVPFPKEYFAESLKHLDTGETF